jgi:hypothetical protein
MPTRPHTDTETMVDAIQKWCLRHLGRRARRVTVTLEDGEKLKLPVTLPREPAEEDQPFAPTDFQEAILEALEGKALRTDALAAKVGDRRRLFRHPGGIKELIEQGLVKHHDRLGYYRPDAPPPELEGDV